MPAGGRGRGLGQAIGAIMPPCRAQKCLYWHKWAVVMVGLTGSWPCWLVGGGGTEGLASVGRGHSRAWQPLSGLQELFQWCLRQGAASARGSLHCSCQAPASLSSPDINQGCAYWSEWHMPPCSPGWCWQLLQPLQQPCCKEQHRHNLPVDPKTRAPPWPRGVPTW